jgi:glutaredoxin
MSDDLKLTPEQRAAYIRNMFESSELDPASTQLTLNHAYERATPEALLAASQKIIKLSRGEARADNRDSLAFQTVHGTEDFLADKIRNDQNRILQNNLWKATNRGSLDRIPSGVLDAHTNHMLTDSGLGFVLEEINPLEILDQSHKVTRMGEGALPSLDSVPDSARNVQPSYAGFVDLVRSPESLKVGVDLNLARNVRKGPDNLLYTQFLDITTGKPKWVSHQEAATSIIGSSDDYDPKAAFVPAIAGMDGIQYVPRESVKYLIRSGDDLFSELAGTVPMKSGVKGMRLLMGSKFIKSAVPLVNREAALVQSEDAHGNSLFKSLASRVGAQFADQDGIVEAVTDNSIKIRYTDGTIEDKELYINHPYSRKTFLHNTPQVTPGQAVKKGDILASSNFTDDKGTLALGVNLRTGYSSAHGKVFEDSIVISESAAKKLASQHMYHEDVEEDAEVKYDKRRFMMSFPGKFTKEQLAKLDDNGVVRPGQVLETGDPVYVGVRQLQPGPGRLIKNRLAPEIVRWEHKHPGTVTDIGKTKKGYSAYIQSISPMEPGDKLMLPYGGKGVVSEIIPDEQMFKDAEGNTLDMLMSPLGVISRTNSAQLAAASLAKIASKTGKPYVLPGFMDENMTQFALNELEKHGLTDREDLTDPTNGRTIPQVFVGVHHVYKGSQMAESKGKSRGIAGYTMDDQPSKGGADGAKHMGSMELRGLLSHGAFDVLKDMKMIKGQRSDDFWRKLKLGQTPVMPGTPTTYTKFKEMIKAAGVNLVEENDAVRIFGMTDSQAEKLTGNRKLESAGTFNQQNFKPIASGLFDPEATDSMGAGNRWAYYALPEPVLNPIMAEPVRRILGLTNAQLDAVMHGEQKIGNGYGGKALKEHLDSLDLSKIIDNARQTLRTGSKSVRDDAIKTLAYAVAMQREGVKPSEFMMTRVPVLPPAFRPITQMSGRTMVADPNYMYLNLKNAIDDFEDAKILPPELQTEARKTMVQSYKALIGLVDPEQEKLQSKNVGGILQSILGKSSPKLGYVQRRVIGTNIDMAGLGVATLNPNLKLNEVGLPMEEAWKLYEPFVVRGLVQQGLPAMQAAEAVASRSPKAFTVLKSVVEERPVIVNRAPTLHRYGMMALWPKLVKGHAIQMAPGIHTPYNLDHDGNCVDFHSEISVRIPMSTLDKFLASIYSCDVVSSTSQGDLSMRVTSETTVQVTADNHFGYITMPIGKFPRAGVPKKDLNGADTYDVSGFNASALSYDIQTGKASYEPITAFTVEQDCECRDVKLQTRQVIVSSNESLSVFDPETSDLVKTKPDDAIGKLCPVIKQDPSPFGQSWNRDFGWMLGMFVSDGWLSENYVGLAKTEACKRQEFVRIAREQLDPELLVREYADKKGVNKYGDSCKAHLYGDTLHRRIFELDTTTINPEGKRQAITKRLPARFLQQGSEEFLWGLLSGMVDGDGGFVKNTTLENPRYSVRFNTSSEDLRDGCIALCYRLGLRCSVTDKDAFATSKISYVMHISTVDIYPHLDKLTCVGKRETSIKNEWQLAGPPSEIGASAGIPISHAEAKALCALARMQTPPDNSAYTTCHKVIKGKQGRIMRSTVAKLLATPGAPELPALRARLNPDIVWEQVNESKEVEPREVFDFEVPTTKVFAVNNGLVVYDTLSYSVPVSKSAVDQAKNTMMPQHHLLSTQDDSPHYAPGQDYLMGMYLASKEPANVPAKRFATWQDAERAYRKGEIDIDTPVVVQ